MEDLVQDVRLAARSASTVGVSGEEFEQFPDWHVCFCWVAEGAVLAEGVARAASVAFAVQVAVLFEVGDDAQGGAFGDVAGRGDVAKAAGRVASDDQQYAGVVGEEA